MAAGGRAVIGYITGFSVKVSVEGVVYFVSLATVSGEDYVVRLKQPPEWVRVGRVVSGTLVKTVEGYQVQDLRRPEELADARAIEVENLEINYVKVGDVKQPILTGRSSNAYVSAPVISASVFKKAEKFLHNSCVLYLADLPTGSKVIAVQSPREFKREIAFQKFLEMVGKDEG